MDFGLPLELDGTGEGDWFLENGLLRTCPVFEAMLCCAHAVEFVTGVGVEQLQAIELMARCRWRCCGLAGEERQIRRSIQCSAAT
jgi:hypothetical protein